jgi:dihydroxy-acid dehydratase
MPAKTCCSSTFSDEELAQRRAAWQPHKPNYTRGILGKYAKLVSSSSRGAIVTDLDLFE